jgi:ribonucleoside-diphosphate reductase alpha chain
MKIEWLNEYSQQFLESGYLLPNQSVQNRIQIIGDTAERILRETLINRENEYLLDGFSLKIQSYISKGWISLSSPVWSNFGTNRGMPISCFGISIPDTMEGIMFSAAEIGMMSKYGGGTAGYFGDIRSRGSLITNNGTSDGTIPFLELFQTVSNVTKQGSVRRGYFAGYIPIEHGDFEEWLNIRSEGSPLQHITWGVCVPTWWLEQMKAGDEEKREKWAKVIKKRFETGLPYISYTDNVNNQRPQVYVDKGTLIKAPQLCTEIFLQSDELNSYVCNLLSYNDLYFDEYSKTDCVQIGTWFMDAVTSEFLNKSKDVEFLKRAYKFASEQRAVGAGRLGYHSLLQSKMIPFESLQARNYNVQIQKYLQEQTFIANKDLAVNYGESKLLEGYGLRMVTTQAIAPTTSSAFIMQVSQSIEPWMANLMIKDLAKGKYVIKNKYLEKLLEDKGKNEGNIWDSILKQQGSVLHLDFLTDGEKSVFKTAREINQEEIIIQAAQRQKFIDQGQSLNLFVTADTSAKEVNKLMLLAHDMGVKSLYYQHNVNAASEFAKKFTNCISCE